MANQKPKPRRATPPQLRRAYWIDVLDHMPDDEMSVLVGTNRSADSEVNLGWHADGVWRDCASAEIIADVTHWMDLPEPPTPFRKK